MIEQDGVILDEWFFANGRWHAWKADTAMATEGFEGQAGTEAWCRTVLLGEQDTVQATMENPYPPTPCPGCLRATAMRDAEDEPLDVARGRGYFPAPD